MTEPNESQLQPRHPRDLVGTLAVFSPVPEVTLVDHDPSQEECPDGAQDAAALLFVVCMIGVAALYWLVNQ